MDIIAYCSSRSPTCAMQPIDRRTAEAHFRTTDSKSRGSLLGIALSSIRRTSALTLAPASDDPAFVVVVDACCCRSGSMQSHSCVIAVLEWPKAWHSRNSQVHFAGRMSQADAAVHRFPASITRQPYGLISGSSDWSVVTEAVDNCTVNKSFIEL